MDTEAFLAVLAGQRGYRQQIAHIEHFDRRQARHAPLRGEIHHLLRAALEVRGLLPLYEHQARAVDALLDSKNVVVATGPASGKSLVYNIPVLDAFLRGRPASRALYLFPTKALAQDQMRALGEVTASLPRRPVVAIYDGDTPQNERGGIRRSADIILTNPEMLHLGILPNHRQWGPFLRSLRYVIIDEAHVYRGIFGSHVGLLLRRLRRVAMAYGAAPRFVVTSATLGNPQDHARALIGAEVEAITDDAAPSGGRDFVLWNPPIIDDARAARRSPMREGSELFTDVVASGTRALAFVRSRQTAELVFRYTREDLAKQGSPFANRVSPYRAGYVAKERREIEAALSDGGLIGVVATNALELGIDIGDLDAAVLIGYPGSLAATFQQAGRAGRRGERALAILVVSENPLEQYLARHPDILFRRGAEYALVSLTNPKILGPHLLCAAYEAPLINRDAHWFGGEDPFRDAVRHLVNDGLLLERGIGDRIIRWHLSPTQRYPAESVHLRSTSGDRYVLVERDSGRVLETLGEQETFSNAHPGAVYLHRGEEFVITELDLASRTAYLSAVQTALPYYTQSMEDTDLRVGDPLASRPVGQGSVVLGKVDVTRTVIGYRRKRHEGSEVLGVEYVDLPPRDFSTVALWWTVPPPVVAEMRERGLDVAGGLHACEHAAIGLLPLFALCDRWDIGGLSTPKHPDTGEATIFIYDGHPGGVGIAERGFAVVDELWQTTLDLLRECGCEEGCPSCIQSPKCGNNNEPLDKQAAKFILEHLLTAATGVSAQRADAISPSEIDQTDTQRMGAVPRPRASN